MVKTVTTPNGDVFRIETDRLDVTSMHRPDTGWRFTDAAGHEHCWYIDPVRPADGYNPSAKYSTPTLKWVKDGEAYWPDDDEPHDVGHNECVQCGEHIEPRYTADTQAQHITGISYCYINDESVSPEEFQQRFERAAKERSTRQSPE